MSIDMTTECQPTYRPILSTDTHPRGSQITPDPMKVIQTQSKPNSSYFPMEHLEEDV